MTHSMRGQEILQQVSAVSSKRITTGLAFAFSLACCKAKFNPFKLKKIVIPD